MLVGAPPTSAVIALIVGSLGVAVALAASAFQLRAARRAATSTSSLQSEVQQALELGRTIEASSETAIQRLEDAASSLATLRHEQGGKPDPAALRTAVGIASDTVQVLDDFLTRAREYQQAAESIARHSQAEPELAHQSAELAKDAQTITDLLEQAERLRDQLLNGLRQMNEAVERLGTGEPTDDIPT